MSIKMIIIMSVIIWKCTLLQGLNNEIIEESKMGSVNHNYDTDLTSSSSENNANKRGRNCLDKIVNNADLNARLRQIALQNHLAININEPMRTELLEQFLAANIFKSSDKINTMLVPEYRDLLQDPIAILKSNSEKYIKMNPNSTIVGPKACSLERVAYERYKTPVPICPWRWIVTIRDDRYPFKRANAKCNCVNCQAKTIYDSDLGKLSSCKTETILMPVLFRESFKNETEKWVFYLEEVPVSCVCSIRLNPIFI